MCCNGGFPNSNIDKANVFRKYFKALHCPIRWNIIAIIGHGTKGTNEIYDTLVRQGETIARSSLYYHLGELRDSGIIDVSGYREEGGGAPEKLWKLETHEIKINLIEDMKYEESEQDNTQTASKIKRGV